MAELNGSDFTEEKSSAGLAIGLSLGLVVVIALIVVFVYYKKCNKSRPSPSPYPATPVGERGDSYFDKGKKAQFEDVSIGAPVDVAVGGPVGAPVLHYPELNS